MNKPVIKGNKITVPSDTQFLTDVDVFIEGILRGYGASESLIADIAISVSELVNNAITHGNKTSTQKEVEVEINKNGNDVVIAVADQGGGFNPEEVDDPLAEENLLKEVGRGIFIVRSLMDKVEIKPNTHGTTVTITKAI